MELSGTLKGGFFGWRAAAKNEKEKMNLRLYQDEEGKTQATFAKSERPEDEICDFCCGPGPFRIFLAKQFTIEPFVFEPEWNACHECAEFIDERDQTGLATRSLTQMDSKLEDLSDIQEVQGKFFENLEGEKRSPFLIVKR